MWDEQKRARFQELRQREEEGTLTEAEQAALTALIHEIEQAEAAYLRPATERLAAECRRIEAQNAALAVLVQREEDLIRKLKSVLSEAEAERHAIEKEKARILSESEVASGAAP